jgi:hypothetical protein
LSSQSSTFASFLACRVAMDTAGRSDHTGQSGRADQKPS